jgi:TRAP-type C4-dicarboxylate transport system permease small subunit
MSETNTSSRGIAGILDAFDGVIARIEEFMMAIGVILMAINTIANVISRFVFNHSIIFAEELNSVFILLVTFAGVGYAARHGRHIRMSAIYDSLSDGKRKFMMILITAVTAVCMLFLAWFSVYYIIGLQAQGRVMPALGVPIYLVYLWVPIGFFVTGVQYALTMVKNIREKEIYLSTNLHEHEAQEIEV